MITVMHWAVRHFRKEKLKRAASVSSSVDDRADFRIIRYRCSHAGSLPTATHLAVPTAAAAPTAPAAPVTPVDQGAPGPQTLADWAAGECKSSGFKLDATSAVPHIHSHSSDIQRPDRLQVTRAQSRALWATGSVEALALRRLALRPWLVPMVWKSPVRPASESIHYPEPIRHQLLRSKGVLT